MREWLSGGAPPCQGGGRGFDPRLALWGRVFGYCVGRWLGTFLSRSYEPRDGKKGSICVKLVCKQMLPFFLSCGDSRDEADRRSASYGL